MAKKKKSSAAVTAESMGQKQREISVSEFFLKNRHLLGFDNPRKALMTTVKEAVDNALDACEEAGILPEVSIDIRQTGENRFVVEVTDNGPGVVRAQIPKIFAKLLYGSKFHRLRMSRGQQGIGISAAGMYGQLTTGSATEIISKTKSKKAAVAVRVQLDTKKNKPAILSDEEVEWRPRFFPTDKEGKVGRKIEFSHGTSVSIEMEASYVRGKLSVDEYLKQCAIVNPHIQLHYRVVLMTKSELVESEAETGKKKSKKADPEEPTDVSSAWTTFFRKSKAVPEPPTEIKPHPHGVELGILMQMLKDTDARTLRSALSQDFSRVSSAMALKNCDSAKLNPKARPARIAHLESEALYKALSKAKLMRPPTDCLSPIGEEEMLVGLKKEVKADFYTAVTRSPTVYRGNPFQVEVALAYAKAGENEDLLADESARLMRFANRVPLLYMQGACAISKACAATKWKSYGLQQPRGGLPVGPMIIMVHIASVWVPFTSESKEAIAHYPEIIKEVTFALQECGRRLSVYLSKRQREVETLRKHDYIVRYIPHLALGLKDVLELSDKQEQKIIKNLSDMLERTRLEL